jgi:hypothetical protein
MFNPRVATWKGGGDRVALIGTDVASRTCPTFPPLTCRAHNIAGLLDNSFRADSKQVTNGGRTQAR